MIREEISLARELSVDLSGSKTEQSRLAALIPELRVRIRIAADVTDDDLLREISKIAALRTGAERWRAAFNSEIGRSLAARGTDLNTALNIILGVIPVQRR